MIKLAKFFGSKFLFLGSITKAAQQIVKNSCWRYTVWNTATVPSFLP